MAANDNDNYEYLLLGFLMASGNVFQSERVIDIFRRLTRGRHVDPELEELFYEVSRYGRRYDSPERLEKALFEGFRMLADSISRQSSETADVLNSSYNFLGQSLARQSADNVRLINDALSILGKSLTDGLSDIYRTVDIGQQQDKLTARIDTQEANLIAAKHDLYEYIGTTSIGLDPDYCRIHRFVPVKVYVTDDNQERIDTLSSRINDLLTTLDFEQADELPEQRGSWFKEWVVRTKEKLTQPEVRAKIDEIARTAEHGAKTHLLEKQQADINKAHAEALKAAVEAMGQSDGVMQLGSLLIVKKTKAGKSLIASRTLTTQEMIFLTQNQHLLFQPQQILTALESCMNDGDGEVGVVGPSTSALANREARRRLLALGDPSQGL